MKDPAIFNWHRWISALLAAGLALDLALLAASIAEDENDNAIKFFCIALGVAVLWFLIELAFSEDLE